MASTEGLTVTDQPAQATYDGLSAVDLAVRLGVPELALRDEVASTQDVAHALAADGAPAGTLVIADAQRAGRGRLGREWRSVAGAGITWPPALPVAGGKLAGILVETRWRAAPPAWVAIGFGLNVTTPPDVAD